ncbi:uncharacterized protein LOC134682047 [Mytilus trossulus]|uniref:uncharacterized protein LOC134682047 n=1 Tax=Mytilus trossulus TaxID=6551 RepID=UPI0030044295
MKSITILFFAFVNFDLSMMEEIECTGPNCEQIVSMPLLDKMEATLKADLDIRKLNKFIKSYIHKVVKEEIENTMRADMFEIMNVSMSKINRLFDDRTNEMKIDLDSKFDKLRKGKEIHNKDSMVLLCTKGQGGVVAGGSTIRFQQAARSTGISSTALNKFKGNGKFVCEAQGLYLVAANIITETDGGWFKIMKNNVELSRTYIAYHRGKASGWHSSTGVTYVMLNKLDNVYIQAGTTMTLAGAETTLNIIKIG